MEKEAPDRDEGSGRGPGDNAADRLFASLYADLRRLADRELQRNPLASVSPTTLVHEAYLNFSAREGLSIDERGRFLAYAGRAMRGLLIDLVRQRQALKRGAGFHITRLQTEGGEELPGAAQLPSADELSRLSDAIEALSVVDARLAEVVDLKYFCGFSFADIAALRGASERTVQRDWEKARLILFEQLRETD